MSFAHAIPTFATAFLAAMVEAVEALTVVLAVASVRGWRPAGLGALAALAVLAVIVLVLSPLIPLIPLQLLHLAIGALLLWFGATWLRKAVLRAAGRMPLHDEVAAFAEETAELRQQARSHPAHLDWMAGVSSFQAVFMEGLEVVIFVIALSAAHGTLIPASGGAIAACLLVAAIGVALQRPLTQVPENTVKFVVGVMLLAFGAYWFAEGVGFEWPGGALAIPALAVMFLVCGGLAVSVLRRSREISE